RPAPWLDLFGNPIQDYGQGGFEPWPLPNTEIAAFKLIRSEQLLRNFFFTFPERFRSYASMVKDQPGELEGFMRDPYMQPNPFLVGFRDARDIPIPPGHGLASIDSLAGPGDIPIADYQRFGFRMMELQTPYIDWERPSKRGVIAKKLV